MRGRGEAEERWRFLAGSDINVDRFFCAKRGLRSRRRVGRARRTKNNNYAPAVTHCVWTAESPAACWLGGGRRGGERGAFGTQGQAHTTQRDTHLNFPGWKRRLTGTKAVIIAVFLRAEARGEG